MIHPIPKPHPKSMSIQVLTSQNLAKSAAFPATKRESGKCHCYWDGGQPKVYVPTIYYKIQLNGGNIPHWSYQNQCNLNLSIFQWRQGSLVFGSTRPPQKRAAAFNAWGEMRNFSGPWKPLKRAREIGQTLLCHEWLPKETVPKRMPFGFFLGFMKSGKNNKQKFLVFLSQFFRVLTHLFDNFDGFSFTEFHQQPGICASISSFTVVFSTSSSPKVLNHSAESAWFNSAASNLVLVANMASAPTPAKPRPKHQVKQQQFISQEEVNISKKYCWSSSKTASNKQLTPPFLKKNTRDVGDFWLLTNILRFRRSGGLST